MASKGLRANYLSSYTKSWSGLQLFAPTLPHVPIAIGSIVWQSITAIPSPKSFFLFSHAIQSRGSWGRFYILGPNKVCASAIFQFIFLCIQFYIGMDYKSLTACWVVFGFNIIFEFLLLFPLISIQSYKELHQSLSCNL